VHDLRSPIAILDLNAGRLLTRQGTLCDGRSQSSGRSTSTGTYEASEITTLYRYSGRQKDCPKHFRLLAANGRALLRSH
jgi:hypothetical protein